MAARAMWKGVIRLGDVGVPVKLYSGVEDRSIHFRLLHEEDLVPVKQHMVHPDTGEVIEYSDALRAYETDEGEFVILDEEDLSELEPESSRDIEVTRFVDSEALDHAWYDRPYYLGPDGSSDAYEALVQALEASDRTGIVRWVMRNKEYRGAVRSRGATLMLMTLHAVEEMIPVASLNAPEGRDLLDTELSMAEQLVAALTAPFDPSEYENEHRARVRELIRAKDAGEVVEFPRHEPPPAEEGDLGETLKASLEKVAGRKSA